MIFWKKLYPGLYGLLIYTCIRLITDTASQYNVLLYRNIHNNILEIIASILLGYLIFFILRTFEKSKQTTLKINPREILKEFGSLSLVTFVSINSTIGVLVATTDDGMDSHDFVVINLIPLLFVLVAYSIRRGNSLLKSYINQKLELERTKRDKAETELEFLKGQYHPHFLFNALNTIYFQMDESTEQAKKTLEKLSDLLRYQLYENQQGKVPLMKELDFIKKYAVLQKERLPADVKMEIHFEINKKNEIYPLLLMPLVENAFKYVNGEEKYILLHAATDEKTFTFNVTNSYNQQINHSEYSGLGLTNLKRRLQLLYPGYSLETKAEKDQFFVQLKLQLR